MTQFEITPAGTALVAIETHLAAAERALADVIVDDPQAPAGVRDAYRAVVRGIEALDQITCEMPS